MEIHSAALLTSCEKSHSTALNLDRMQNVRPEMPSYFQAWEGNALLGALSVFSPLPKTAELGVFVLPPHRRKGVLTALLAEAMPILRAHGFSSLLFPCEATSLEGAAVARHWGLTSEFSEYQMVYRGPPPAAPTQRFSFRPGTLADLPALADLSAATGEDAAARQDIEATLRAAHTLWRTVWLEDNLVGAARVSLEGPVLTLHGVAVLPCAQGHGVGRALLSAVLQELRQSFPDRAIFLEADSKHQRALQLYATSGFTVRHQVDYYRKPLSSVTASA